MRIKIIFPENFFTNAMFYIVDIQTFKIYFRKLKYFVGKFDENNFKIYIKCSTFVMQRGREVSRINLFAGITFA